MSKFETRERFVYLFETALQNAGMQDGKTGQDTEKPRYWRTQVLNSDEALFLLYVVTDNLPLDNADNKSIRRELYINGEVFTRNGFNDGEFQDLCVAIETECEKLGLYCNFDSEGRDTSIDTESPVDYVNFEVEARLLNK